MINSKILSNIVQGLSLVERNAPAGSRGAVAGWGGVVPLPDGGGRGGGAVGVGGAQADRVSTTWWVWRAWHTWHLRGDYWIWWLWWYWYYRGSVWCKVWTRRNTSPSCAHTLGTCNTASTVPVVDKIVRLPTTRSRLTWRARKLRNVKTTYCLYLSWCVQGDSWKLICLLTYVKGYDVLS